MIKMPKELKDKWLAALRSSEYPQGYFRLKADTGYCCLGVLQMVACGEVEMHTSTGRSWTIPSTPWLIRHKIKVNDDWVTSKGSLTTLNDSGVVPFTELADIIEAEVLTYEESNHG